jgi:hypothetical protein
VGLAFNEGAGAAGNKRSPIPHGESGNCVTDSTFDFNTMESAGWLLPNDAAIGWTEFNRIGESATNTNALHPAVAGASENLTNPRKKSIVSVLWSVAIAQW